MKWEIDEMGVDHMQVDQMGVDEVGINRFIELTGD